MPIPGLKNFMLPLLTQAGDGEEHSLSECIDRMAQHFTLTEEDQRELLLSGWQGRLYNRVAWALTHLKKAVLLQSTGRGKYRITERGFGVLRTQPGSIDIQFLMQFPEFQEFRKSQNVPDEHFVNDAVAK